MNGQTVKDNNKILLICGTAETTKLSHAIADAGFSVLLSTATDAYLEIDPEIKSESMRKITRRWGRLNQDGFINLIKQECICAVVNACHPYASDLRATAIKAAELSGVPCFNYNRPEHEFSELNNCIIATTHEEAAEIAFSFEKTVLLTTGSNNLIPYVNTARAKGIKLITRVLPRIESISACMNAGLSDLEIIAARGPFTIEENIASIKRFNAGIIVTKSSGKEGGFLEKIEAAQRCNCKVVIVKRPETTIAEKTFSDIFSLINSLRTSEFLLDAKKPSPHHQTRHGGNLREIAEQSGLEADKIIDFSANINPIGPVPDLNKILEKTFKEIINYPDPDYTELKKSISKFGGWHAEMIIPANGASELLYAAAAITTGKRALIPVPSYSDYTEAAKRAALEVIHVKTIEKDNFLLNINTLSEHIKDRDIVFIGRPNNPIGNCIDITSLVSFIRTNPNSTFIVDESFLEFSPETVSIAADLPQNAIMIRSMTKFYAIPGLRLGYAIAHPGVAQKINSQLTPWSVNCFAQAAGITSLENTLYQKESFTFTKAARTEFVKNLSELSYLRVFPSDSNFVLVKLDEELNGTQLQKEFLKHGLAIRRCSNFTGLNDQFIRVAIKTVQENECFVKILKKIWNNKRA